MRTLYTALLCLQLVHAGYVTPNIKRDKTQLNQSGIAVALSDRNNLSLVRSSEEEDRDDSDYRSEEESFSLQARLSQKNVKAELYASRNNLTEKQQDYDLDRTLLGGAMGLELGRDLLVGGGLNFFDGDSGGGDGQLDSYKASASLGWLKSDQLLVGGGISADKTTSYDGLTKAAFIGVGVIQDRFVLEGVLRYQIPSELENDEGLKFYDRSKVLWLLQAIKQTDKWEFSARALIELSESHENYKEYDYEGFHSFLGVEVEYLLTEQFALGFGVGRSTSEDEYLGEDIDENYDTDILTFRPKLRYRNQRFQVQGWLNFGDRDTDFTDSGVKEAFSYERAASVIELAYFL